MSCYHPIMFTQSVDPRTGELLAPRSWKQGYLSDFDDFQKKNPSVRCFVVPCGQCEACRSDYAKTWAARLVLESLYQGDGRSWFVTLTYDDEHLPIAHTVDRVTGLVGDFPVIRMSDFSAWIKRVRSRLNQPGIRFYLAAEYGDSTRRCHAHCILFASLPDVRSVRPSDGGRFVDLPSGVLYSEVLQDCWSLGYVTVSPASYATMAYTAGYAVKKLRGLHEKEYQDYVKSLQVDDPDIVPQPSESSRMSRRPGIGVPWLLSRDIRSVWRSGGSVAIPTPSGARQTVLPRVFESWSSSEASDLIDDAKQRRSDRASVGRYLMRLSDPDRSIESWLLDEESARASFSRVRKKIRGSL